MKIKKLIVAILCLIMIVASFSACSNSKDSGSEREDEEIEEEETESTSDVVETTKTTETTVVDEDISHPSREDGHASGQETVETTVYTEPEVTYIEYNIEQVLSVVSEDRVWVEYSDGSMNDVIALIDTEGNELFSVSGDAEYGTPLSGGTGFCDFSDMKNGAAYVRDNNTNTIYIVDADGNELNSFTDSADTHYSLVGADGGYFLIYEFDSAFSSNTHIFHIVDPSGTIVYSRDLSDADSSYSMKEELSVHADLIDDLTFLVRFPSGSLYSDDMFLAQMDVPNVVYANNPDYANSICGTEGYFVDNCWRSATIVPMDTYADDAAFADVLENFGDNGYSISTEDDRICSSAEYGYVFFESYDYNVSTIYDLAAEEWVTILTFPEGVTINNIMCYDGYCFYQLTGNDGNRYITTADTEGNMLYEPEPSPFNEYAILNLDGSTVFSSDVNLFVLESGNTVGINSLPNGFELRVNHRFQDNAIYMTSGISDGYIVPVNPNGLPNYFCSLDGSVVVSTVKTELGV